MAKPTINDVAERAGVSPSSVSIYLNNRPGISASTKERIAEAIAEVGYIPRSSSSQSKTNGFIGLIVEKLPATLTGDYFYSDVANGIHEAAEKLGYNVAISVINEPIASLPRLVEEDAVVGLIALGGGDVTDKLLQRISDNNTPLVTVDNQSNIQPLNSVLVDNYRGAYLATQHLIELGHERIAVIQGPRKYKSLTERFHGYINALVDAGIKIEEELVQPPLSKGKPNKGYLEMKALLEMKYPPTAVFTITDRTALGAFRAIREAGLIVPEDISIVGFDNLPPHAYPPPAITSVGSHRLEMGHIAVQRLDQLINDSNLVPISIVMPCSLIVRDTTRRI